MYLVRIFLAVAYSLHLSTATTLTLKFQPSTLTPSLAVLPPSTHAILASGNVTIRAPLSRSNSIHFARIPPGSYLCDVYTRDFVVIPMRIDVKASSDKASGEDLSRGQEEGSIEVWQTFRGNEWSNKGERLGGGQGGCEVNIRAMSQKKFYEERTGFSPLSLLRNPMILLGVVGLAIMVGMPKIMENMDPEMREEFEKQQKSSVLAQGITGGSPMGGFDVASWMAGTSTGARKGGTDSGSKARKRG